jgi:hypothetical protein
MVQIQKNLSYFGLNFWMTAHFPWFRRAKKTFETANFMTIASLWIKEPIYGLLFIRDDSQKIW